MNKKDIEQMASELASYQKAIECIYDSLMCCTKIEPQAKLSISNDMGKTIWNLDSVIWDLNHLELKDN